MHDAITDAPSSRHPARILQSYKRLGYQFFDCFTREGLRIGIAARSFTHAKNHADRISRNGKVRIVRIREVTVPDEAADRRRPYRPTDPPMDPD
jgi:hypothetical protein